VSQNDLVIANQSAPDFRSDLNDALQALASLSSGSTAPSTTYANMLWYDISNNILKMRSEANDSWINVGYLCQSTNKFCILDDTNVVNTSGTQTGLLGDQSTATWEDGTSTTESLVSPAKVKAAIDANASGVGDGQTWQDVSGIRSLDVSVQNTYGEPIMVQLQGSRGNSVEVSTDNSTWVSMGFLGTPGAFDVSISFVLPPSHYYIVRSNAGSPARWVELR